LLPVEWRQINAYGIRIGYRTYDRAELGPYRLQHSGITAKRGLWEVHYDPYDATHVFVRTTDGWITVPWTHVPMVFAPFAEFTWRHARRLAAQKGKDDTNETEVARVLDDLLTRAQAGPVDRLSDPRRRPHPGHRHKPPAGPRRATRGWVPRPGRRRRHAAGHGDPVRDLRRRRGGRPMNRPPPRTRCWW